MSTVERIAVWGFRWVPPFAQGLVRDLRVRWALEEAGRAYESRLVGIEERNSEVYRRKHPFGMVPVLDIGGERIPSLDRNTLPGGGRTAPCRDLCLHLIVESAESLQHFHDRLVFRQHGRRNQHFESRRFDCQAAAVIELYFHVR